MNKNLGETERNWNKQEERKNIHGPMLQHNTTKIFKLIHTTDSFFTPYCD